MINSIPGLQSLAVSCILLQVVTTENTDRLLSLREVKPYSACQPLLGSAQKNFLSTSKTCISTLNVATSKIKFIVLENLKLTGKVSAAVPGWYGGCEEKRGLGGGVGEWAGRVLREPGTLCCFVCFAVRRSQRDLWRCLTQE